MRVSEPRYFIHWRTYCWDGDIYVTRYPTPVLIENAICAMQTLRNWMADECNGLDVWLVPA